MVVFNINVSAYELGSLIEYNKNTYYVISDNGDSLTLIKKEPLTKDEVNKYGVGHINNHTKYKTGDPTLDRIYEKEVVEVACINLFCFDCGSSSCSAVGKRI